MYKVYNIKDSRTLQVTPNWSHCGVTGSDVTIIGYVTKLNFKSDVPIEVVEHLAFTKLKFLLFNKVVDLRIRPSESGSSLKNKILYCRVYLNDIDVSNYFYEFGKI